MKRAAISSLLPVLTALFYITCLLQWMWASLPYLPQILGLIETWQLSSTQPAVEPVLQQAPVAPPSMLMVIFGIIVIIVVISIAIYAFIKLPSSIAKSGETVAKAATKRIVPVVTGHKQLPAKKRRQLTARILFNVKLAMCMLPIAITALAYNVSSELPYDITMLIAAILGICALSLLVLHTLASKLHHRRFS